MDWGEKVELKKLRVKNKLGNLSASSSLRLVKLEEKNLATKSIVLKHWDIKALKKLRNGKIT